MRIVTILLLLGGVAGQAAPSPELERALRAAGLTEAQVASALEGLRLAGAPDCDNARECLEVALSDLRVAGALARASRSPEQIAAAIRERPTSDAPEPAPFVDLSIPVWSPRRGPQNAPVTIVTWLDYQCPFSQRLDVTFKALAKKYPGKLRFVVRHMPLPLHRDAEALALLSMAAQQHDRFWEFHDRLYATQVAPGRTDGERVLKELKVPFTEASPQAREQLAADVEAGRAVEATATPTSFVNGKRVAGAQPLSAWVAEVEEALGRARDASRLGK